MFEKRKGRESGRREKMRMLEYIFFTCVVSLMPNRLDRFVIVCFVVVLPRMPLPVVARMRFGCDPVLVVFWKSIAYPEVCIYERFVRHVCIPPFATQQGLLRCCSSRDFLSVNHLLSCPCAQFRQRTASPLAFVAHVLTVRFCLRFCMLDGLTRCESKCRSLASMICVKRLYKYLFSFPRRLQTKVVFTRRTKYINDHFCVIQRCV